MYKNKESKMKGKGNLIHCVHRVHNVCVIEWLSSDQFSRGFVLEAC